jgi:exopolyphosphatase/guanosine-5'-triphosphate,3'-diphosphate pyrophosphatase
MTRSSKSDSHAAGKKDAIVRNQPVAVIDIGSTSIRMAIGEKRGNKIHVLERLTQAVNLGKDAFTQNHINRSTMEACVDVLRTYRRKLGEYGIDQTSRIRVVATTAVREARNRLAFLDRIFIATGLIVEPIDEADVNRITYLGVQPLLDAQPELAEGRTLVMEVGGGSTEVLLLQRQNVVLSHNFRLGSLRLRKMLETFRTPVSKVRQIMEIQIRRLAEQLARECDIGGLELIALGGDVRFAVDKLIGDWDFSQAAKIPLDGLQRITDKILKMQPDELVQRFHLSLPSAETLGPALLAYVMVCQEFGLEHLNVAGVNLRDGLLQEMFEDDLWDAEFNNQIVASALELGRRFGVDEPHALRVAELSRTLFRGLSDHHRLESRYEILLYVTALLHEVGLHISNRSMHKHSMYVIQNSELFGLGERDLMLVALVARYHRRASPQATHTGYGSLPLERRVIVTKLAAILRVAAALDESRSQRIQEVECHCLKNRFVVGIPGVEDLSLETLALQQSGTLFEETYGMRVQLRHKPA